MQLLMKSANAVVTLQSGKKEDIELVLQDMDMDALGSAIEHVAKASITSDAAAASPMVTKLLTSAKIIHRLHSARSMNDWDTMSEGKYSKRRSEHREWKHCS